MYLAETNERIVGNVNSLFLVFAADKAFFDQILWLNNKTGNVNSPF